MKLCALLSWFDEEPRHLAEMVASLPLAGVDTLIALDGAYALYPNAKARSPQHNYDTLHAACKTHGIDLDIVTPTKPWKGNEIEKRTHLFHLAEQHTTPDDWYLIIDADEEITKAPADLLLQLEQTPLNVGEATFTEPNPNGKTQTIQIPILFRATRGITVQGNHFTYRTPDGKNLWGNARMQRLEPRHPAGITILHKTWLRQSNRHKAAHTYYHHRDSQRLEYNPAPEPVRPDHLAA